MAGTPGTNLMMSAAREVVLSGTPSYPQVFSYNVDAIAGILSGESAHGITNYHQTTGDWLNTRFPIATINNKTTSNDHAQGDTQLFQLLPILLDGYDNRTWQINLQNKGEQLPFYQGFWQWADGHLLSYQTIGLCAEITVYNTPPPPLNITPIEAMFPIAA